MKCVAPSSQGFLKAISSILLLASFLRATEDPSDNALSRTIRPYSTSISSPYQNVKTALQPKIAGGEVAPPGRFPYMCSIRKRNGGRHMCGGTLIHPLWVLTAAHCMDQQIEPQADLLPVVYCGIYEIATPNATHIFGTVEVVFHEKWKHRVDKGYDIALLKLDREAPFQTAKYDQQGEAFSSGEYLASVGWGYMETGVLAEVLMMAGKLTYLQSSWCEGIIKAQLKECLICAGAGGQDTCKGDSGGPLLSLYTPEWEVGKGSPELDLVVGVVSYGPQQTKCDGTRPGIYTKVFCFAQWIDSKIKAEEIAARTDFEAREKLVKARRQELHNLSKRKLESRTAAAIAEDDDLVVEAALLEGVNPNREYLNKKLQPELNKGNTWLEWASFYGAVECINVLLMYKADVDHEDKDGSSSLHFAAEYGQPEAAKVLLENGADAEHEDNDGWTPLHFASAIGQLRTAMVLIEYGADLEHETHDGNTPLQYAAWRNHAVVAKLLLKHGADIEHKDGDGWTPLHYAVQSNRINIAKVLIEHRADVENADIDGWTPLHYAAGYGHLEMTKILLKARASKTARASDGTLPVDLICILKKCNDSTRAKLKKLLTPPKDD